jgi:hypothetical protein
VDGRLARRLGRVVDLDHVNLGRAGTKPGPTEFEGRWPWNVAQAQDIAVEMRGGGHVAHDQTDVMDRPGNRRSH